MARPTSTNNSDNPRTTSGAGRPSTSGATRTYGSNGREVGATSTTTLHDVTIDDIFDQYKGSKAEDIFRGIWDKSITSADAIQYYQLLLQYLMSQQDYQRQLNYNELSYERSRAYNQVAEMMNAGMSRAAALQALQGGSTPQSAAETQGITPYQPQFNPLDLFNTIIGGVGSLANIGTSLATLPASLSAKRLTNQLLAHQGALLGSQVQGLNDAALFMQAVANAPEDVQKMNLYDQIKYFRNQSSLSEKVPEYNFAAAAFGRTAEFARSMSNPFFYSAVNSAQKDTNLSFASMFEPERLQAYISQARACTELVNNQSQAQVIATKLLSNEEFISDATLQARKDLEELKLYCQQNQIQFDSERAQKMLDRIESFTDYDYESIQYQLAVLRRSASPDIFERERTEMINSLDYNALMYLYGYSLQNVKYRELLNMENEGGVDKKWLKDYFRYQEFGGSAAAAAKQGWWRTGISGVSAAALSAFTGFKIWSGLSAAAGTVASSAGGVAAGLAVPLIVPNTLTSMPNLPSFSGYGLQGLQ